MQGNVESQKSVSNLIETIKAELHLFNLTGSKVPMLQFAYSSLMSIRGSSVESERAFSSAGYFCILF